MTNSNATIKRQTLSFAVKHERELQVVLREFYSPITQYFESADAEENI
jgi:hypothetical protein